jgi:hypothetical protein
MHSARYWLSPLVRRFVAELLKHTIDIADEAAYHVFLTAFKKLDLRAVHASKRPFKAAYP